MMCYLVRKYNETYHTYEYSLILYLLFFNFQTLPFIMGCITMYLLEGETYHTYEYSLFLYLLF